jgi:hypothetical protein
MKEAGSECASDWRGSGRDEWMEKTQIEKADMKEQ